MKICVTGAAGYIGSAVCYKLLERGHQVIGIDSLKYGEIESVPSEVFLNVLDISKPDDQDAIIQALAKFKADAVCHLAAESLIPLSFEEPELFFRVNVSGGLMLLDAMKAAGVSKIVYSSTSSVYKEDSPMPLTEESPIGPSSVYGISKLMFEQSLPWMNGLKWIAFRYFNVCGATKNTTERPYHRSRIIPVALDVARGLLPSMPLNGTDFNTPDGTCVRDYIHVEDIAEAHCLAIEKIGPVQGVFNLGIGSWYSNRQVIQTVEKVTGKPVRVVNSIRRKGDPSQLIADSTKAQKQMGWSPKFKTLESMVQSAWEYEQ